MGPAPAMGAAAAAAAAAAGSAPVGASPVGLAALAAPSSPDASPPCPPWQRSIRQNSRRPKDERWGRARAVAYHSRGGGGLRAARPLLLGRHLRRERRRVRPLRSRLRARRRSSLRVLLLALDVVLVLRHHVRPPHCHLPMRAVRSDEGRGCGRVPSEGGGAHLGLELGRERLGLQLDQIRHLCASRAGVSVGAAPWSGRGGRRTMSSLAQALVNLASVR